MKKFAGIVATTHVSSNDDRYIISDVCVVLDDGDMEMTSLLKGGSIESTCYLLRDLADRLEKHDERMLDTEKSWWALIKKTAANSDWMPEDYKMGDWVAEVCSFLQTGKKNNR